jgi:hypothetical protein
MYIYGPPVGIGQLLHLLAATLSRIYRLFAGG